MAHFPETPNFTGFNTPSRVEADVFDLPHEGEIPGLSLTSHSAETCFWVRSRSAKDSAKWR